jgi:signal transduction histidine kinase/CheY-like chemotaxis protein
MNKKLSFFNWSLSKLLDTEPDSLMRSRIRILYAILIFALIKSLIVLPAAFYAGQDIQVIRTLVFLFVFMGLFKMLLVNKNYAIRIGVLLIWLAMCLVWSNAFITAQEINIVTIQTVVMIVLSSFYLLNWKWGLINSLLSISPIILLLLVNGRGLNNIPPDAVPSPAYETIVVLNFMTIVVTHFLFYEALIKSAKEKELLNLQLQEAVKEAKLAARSKADFLSTMSHELRTPLNSVIGISRLLLESPHDKEQDENLQIVNFSAMSLHALIDNVLDFNKLDSDKISLEAIRVDLYQLVHSIGSGLRFQADKKGLKMNIYVDELIRDMKVITDPTRITQILNNLAGNSIKFTPEGFVSVSLELSHYTDEHLVVKFSVKDSGIGISQDKHEIIFDAFVQASSSTTREFGGTGLGLAIVKQLLILFDSEIHLISKEGEGTEFHFEISFLRDQEDNEIPAESTTVYDLKGIKILIAEDNPANSLLLKKIFSNWNNNDAEYAENGYEVIEKLKEKDFDIVLMDIHMPLLDGYAATKLIRSMNEPYATIPIIALTGSVSDDLYPKIRETGIDDFVYKPFDPDELYQKMKTATRERK